jgi:RimJ/RimL family protein N-acetyltransferase
MLKSQRLILRSFTRDDLPRMCLFNNDVEVELAGGGDPPMPQSLERLQAEFDQETAKGGRDGAHFAIEADTKLIGQIVLHRFSETHRTCELGIAIGDKDYWGKGYGREAIELILDYAFRFRNQRKVFLTVNGNNDRAIRAYRACGFVEEGRWRSHVWSGGEYIDLVCMGILRDEWVARNAASLKNETNV